MCAGNIYDRIRMWAELLRRSQSDYFTTAAEAFAARKNVKRETYPKLVEEW